MNEARASGIAHSINVYLCSSVFIRVEFKPPSGTERLYVIIACR